MALHLIRNPLAIRPVGIRANFQHNCHPSTTRRIDCEHMRRNMRLIGVVIVSLVIAAVLALRWQMAEHHDFETAVQRAFLANEISKNSARCPLSAEAINVAQPWLLVACAETGLGWYEAESTYGTDAEKVYLLYGREPGFAEVFDRYGPVVVPMITYFVRNGSTQYFCKMRSGKVGQAFGATETGEMLPSYRLNSTA
jgi:hypothetical protein